VTFTNADLSGGFVGTYSDTGEEYSSHECFVDGVECRAEEAYLGGIVVEAMTAAMWKPRGGELAVPFDPAERALYEKGDPNGVFHASRWPLYAGRGRFGEFPLVVVREYYRQRGLTVWASEPELPHDGGFILVSYPGKRRRGHSAYARMEALFGVDKLRELNEATDRAKRTETKGVGGGDPDLFVFGGRERFFVEVKWNDDITEKQNATFPLIEAVLGVEVKVVRIEPR
jgi:hypothetical protein